VHRPRGRRKGTKKLIKSSDHRKNVQVVKSLLTKVSIGPRNPRRFRLSTRSQTPLGLHGVPSPTPKNPVVADKPERTRHSLERGALSCSRSFTHSRCFLGGWAAWTPSGAGAEGFCVLFHHYTVIVIGHSIDFGGQARSPAMWAGFDFSFRHSGTDRKLCVVADRAHTNSSSNSRLHRQDSDGIDDPGKVPSRRPERGEGENNDARIIRPKWLRIKNQEFHSL